MYASSLVCKVPHAGLWKLASVQARCNLCQHKRFSDGDDAWQNSVWRDSDEFELTEMIYFG